MSLSSDVDYVRMEYREPDESAPEAPAEGAPASSGADAQPDVAATLAARLEEEKRAIFAQSRAEIEREVQRARAAIGEAIAHFAEQRDNYFRQVESEVVQLSLAIARRIVHRESQIDPQLLAAVVRYELEQLDAATSVRLVVAPDAVRSWSEATVALPRAVEVVGDRTVAPGTLRMETALGSTSISFEGELKEIERGFSDLLSHRPANDEVQPARVQ